MRHVAARRCQPLAASLRRPWSSRSARQPRPGRRPIYTTATDKRILKLRDKPPPQGFARWTGPLLAGELGDVDVQSNGRALTGQSHDYKRHATLFAALEVATGKIMHSKRRRRVEFLDFVDSVTAAFPNRQLHIVLDNLSTYKTNEPWLEQYPNLKFHFTPTSASWLNQVKIWFSILERQSLSGSCFHKSQTARAGHRCLHRSL